MTKISRVIYNWIFKTLSAYKQKILQLNFTLNRIGRFSVNQDWITYAGTPFS